MDVTGYKTGKQADLFNSQTFGIEIEMNGIERNEAAKIASDFFGAKSYKDTSYKYGIDTLSVWDRSGREWKFQTDDSIEGEEKQRCELVTPVLIYGYNNIPCLQELLRKLREAGAKSDAARHCGIHIHVGARGYTPQTLKNLVNIMASHESLLADSLQLDKERMKMFCRMTEPKFIKELNERNPKTMEELADIWYSANSAEYGRQFHNNRSRYHMLNLHSVFTNQTIEFRCFQFDRDIGIDEKQLAAYVQFCLALSKMAKENINVRKQQEKSRKSEMNAWLTEMGLTGDEFAITREIFVKNLIG